MRPAQSVTLAAALMLGACATASTQSGSEGSADFIRSVYASYTDDGPWPIDEERLDAVWSPATAALIRRDRTLSGDELPYLDADPICNCQDFENIRVLDTRTRRDGEGRLIIRVRFINGGMETTTDFRLHGSPTSGWRIDDVLNPHGPSLAENLAASNRQIETGGQALGRE